MYISLSLLQPLLALIAGIAVLARPKLLTYVVAAYLITIGILGLLAHMS